MMSNSLSDLQVAICKALKIDIDRLTYLKLELLPEELPKLTLIYEILPKDPFDTFDERELATVEFDLVPRKDDDTPPAVDVPT